MATESTKIVRIEVRDKVALNRTPEVFLVGGNSDYKVVFDFDEVWGTETLRTAIFVYGGFKPVLVPFTGNECDIPIISGSTVCQVGVTAGDMKTTTPAYVNCKLSIRDIGGEIEPPSQDVYNRIIGMIESGMLKGEQGEKGDKGDKGDAGSIKFIPVTKLPEKTDPTIDQSAIYVEPLANPDEKNKYGEYIFVNGDWEKLGEITIEVDHSEYVKKTDFASDSKVGVVKISNYRGMRMLSGGIITLMEATDAQIGTRNNGGDVSKTTAVTLSKFDTALIKALTDGQLVLTDEEKAKACELLGVGDLVGSIETALDEIITIQNTLIGGEV